VITASSAAPRGAQRADQALAENPLAAEGIERIGRTRPVLDAGIDEFLLEDGFDHEAGLGLKRRQRAAQEIPRAAGPGRAVQLLQVGEVEMLGRALVEGHLHGGFRVRHHHEVARGAEGGRQDRAEGRDHDVGGGEPHALPQPALQLRGRKALAAHEAGQIANAHEDQFFLLHPCVPALLWGDDEAFGGRRKVPARAGLSFASPTQDEAQSVTPQALELPP
jgi:hypothetical protein